MEASKKEIRDQGMDIATTIMKSFVEVVGRKVGLVDRQQEDPPTGTTHLVTNLHYTVFKLCDSIIIGVNISVDYDYVDYHDCSMSS